MKYKLITVALLLTIVSAIPATAREIAKKQFTAAAAGEAVLRLRLAAEGYKWSDGPWAPPLKVILDGRMISSLIPFRGSEEAEYSFILGPVAEGKHIVTLVDPAVVKREIKTSGLEPEVILPGDPRYNPIRHSPILLGRPENDNSDIPLIFWYVEKDNANSKTIDYTIVWSNEDGGTRTAALLAIYGRTVDIENVYTVKLDTSGKILSEVIQGAGHKVRPFAGRKIGSHPVLRTCTENNMVDDTGTSQFVFSYLPVKFDTAGVRERMLDLQPWINRIAFEELVKEDKLTRTPPDISMARVGDLRLYALVDVDVEQFGTRLEVGLRLSGSKKWHTADQKMGPLALALQGKHRVGILLPKNTKPEDIDALQLRSSGFPGSSLSIVSVGPITLLDKDFSAVKIDVPWNNKTTLYTDKDPLVIPLRAPTEPE